MPHDSRYFFEVAYQGTGYHGWQIQENASSVQIVIEKALFTLIQSPIPITGSGRTDTGVHALRQFFHADLPSIDIKDFLYKINKVLPPDISINSIQKVNPKAHARFDAVVRSYTYHIIHHKNPFLKDRAWLLYKRLDLVRMNQAADLLLQYKNFESFSRVKTDVTSFLCKVTEAQWNQTTHGLVFNITSNRFLRGMVRAIVGSIVEVGQHRISIEAFEKMIRDQDRKIAGPSAPAKGLFLSNIKYKDEIFLT